MTLSELENILKKTKLPVAYHHFEPEEAMPPPFIVYIETGSDNFGADNRVYYKVKNVDVELYTDTKDSALEEMLESVLDGAELFYNKDERHIESQNMYEVIYELEVI